MCVLGRTLCQTGKNAVSSRALLLVLEEQQLLAGGGDHFRRTVAELGKLASTEVVRVVVAASLADSDFDASLGQLAATEEVSVSESPLSVQTSKLLVLLVLRAAACLGKRFLVLKLDDNGDVDCHHANAEEEEEPSTQHDCRRFFQSSLRPRLRRGHRNAAVAPSFEDAL